MSSQPLPSEAPPSYDQVTGGSSSQPQGASGHLDVPGRGSGKKSSCAIPAAVRRSMEDESRPLPKGWVRTYDPENEHQFFVDTTKDPPRSIWTHPYDDEDYLKSLSGEERERIEQESIFHKRPQSKADIMAEHTDNDDEDDDYLPQHYANQTGAGSTPSTDLPPRPDGKGKGKESLGRRLKDKVTGSTHEEREVARKKRAEEERKAYEQHMRIREAMSTAMRTGKPQLIGRDRDGKDVYIEPPQYTGGPGYYGGRGYGYSPYGGYPGGGGMGVYATPNARYLRPAAPYGRPYGGAYGGGLGLPIGLGIGGGLLGGALLGGALF